MSSNDLEEVTLNRWDLELSDRHVFSLGLQIAVHARRSTYPQLSSSTYMKLLYRQLFFEPTRAIGGR
jgi:hypothetical protein